MSLLTSHNTLQKVHIPGIVYEPAELNLPALTKIRGLSNLSYLNITITQITCIKMWEKIFTKIGSPCLLTINYVDSVFGQAEHETGEIVRSLSSFNNSVSISLVRLNFIGIRFRPEFVPALEKWWFPCLKALKLQECPESHIILDSLGGLHALSAFALTKLWGDSPQLRQSLSKFLVAVRGLQEIRLQVLRSELPKVSAITFHASTLHTLVILPTSGQSISAIYCAKQQKKIYTKCSLLRHLSLSLESLHEREDIECVCAAQCFFVPLVS